MLVLLFFRLGGFFLDSLLGLFLDLFRLFHRGAGGILGEHGERAQRDGQAQHQADRFLLYPISFLFDGSAPSATYHKPRQMNLALELLLNPLHFGGIFSVIGGSRIYFVKPATYTPRYPSTLASVPITLMMCPICSAPAVRMSTPPSRRGSCSSGMSMYRVPSLVSRPMGCPFCAHFCPQLRCFSPCLPSCR